MTEGRGEAAVGELDEAVARLERAVARLEAAQRASTERPPPAAAAAAHEAADARVRALAATIAARVDAALDRIGQVLAREV